jgi:hypothetical protein
MERSLTATGVTMGGGRGGEGGSGAGTRGRVGRREGSTLERRVNRGGVPNGGRTEVGKGKGTEGTIINTDD